MKRFYVNKNGQVPNGEHEVHDQTCPWLPELQNRIDLGLFSNCADAVREAKKHYSNVDGCKHCSFACHRR